MGPYTTKTHTVLVISVIFKNNSFREINFVGWSVREKISQPPILVVGSFQQNMF